MDFCTIYYKEFFQSLNILKKNPETEARVFSWVEKSICPNAIAMFKNVNNGPKPVNIVGIVWINFELNFEVIRVSSLKKYNGSVVVWKIECAGDTWLMGKGM